MPSSPIIISGGGGAKASKMHKNQRGTGARSSEVKLLNRHVGRNSWGRELCARRWLPSAGWKVRKEGPIKNRKGESRRWGGGNYQKPFDKKQEDAADLKAREDSLGSVT